MDDSGMLEAQFSLARVAGHSNTGWNSRAARDHRNMAKNYIAFGDVPDQDDQLSDLVNRCKAILVSEIPHAFYDTFREQVCYEQGQLADRLAALPGVLVIDRRSGDKKAVRIEFLAYLLATKAFYDSFGHRQENWPSREVKIRTHLQRHMNEISAAHPRLKKWFATATPCVWDYFSSLWSRDFCITWFRDGVNWRPKSMDAVLKNHQDILDGFLGPMPPVRSPAPAQRDCFPVQARAKTSSVAKAGRLPRSSSGVDQNWNVCSESELFSAVGMLSAAHNAGDDLASTADKINAAVTITMRDSDIATIEIITNRQGFSIDCTQIGTGTVCRHLAKFLANGRILKLFHDLYEPGILSLRDGGVSDICGCLDSQLALEFCKGEIFGTLNDVLKHFGTEETQGDEQKNGKYAKNTNASPALGLHNSSDNKPNSALQLWKIRENLLCQLGETFGAIQRASDERAKQQKRRLIFDKKRCFSLISKELIFSLSPDPDFFEPSPLVENSDLEELLYLLPSRVREAIEEIGTANLTEIILDKGRIPSAWINGKRHFLKDDEMPTVEQVDIDLVTGGVECFGSDNRAGIERQLHRISCLRNRSGNIIGLTLRVGRNVNGIADMICDLLLGNNGSVLILGEPASGKTTVVREAARLLSEGDANVCIIDTSNEIAGDGDVPHVCVGNARRMMVPSLNDQADVMIECVQNHAPAIMIIDEIGRPTEVDAARTCKQRGVRMVASAHGDLRKLVKNPKLKGLIGGTETVTLGDVAAKSAAKEKGFSGMHKLKTQRSGAPVFDIIVEVTRDSRHEWCITLDTAVAVDAILEGLPYEVQRRVRDPSDGSFLIRKEKR